MNPKLSALLGFAGIVVVGGVGYLIAAPTGNRAALLDAGITSDCRPAQVDCQVRNNCRELADGGMRRRYGRVTTKAFVCPGPVNGGPDVLVFRWPKRARQACLETYGESPCSFVEPVGTCSDSEVCDEDPSGEQPTKAALERCACRDPLQGDCRARLPDGGTYSIPLGIMTAAPFVGAGCVRGPCEVVGGEQEMALPTICPEQ